VSRRPAGVARGNDAEVRLGREIQAVALALIVIDVPLTRERGGGARRIGEGRRAGGDGTQGQRVVSPRLVQHAQRADAIKLERGDQIARVVRAGRVVGQHDLNIGCLNRHFRRRVLVTRIKGKRSRHSQAADITLLPPSQLPDTLDMVFFPLTLRPNRPTSEWIAGAPFKWRDLLSPAYGCEHRTRPVNYSIGRRRKTAQSNRRPPTDRKRGRPALSFRSRPRLAQPHGPRATKRLAKRRWG